MTATLLEVVPCRAPSLSHVLFRNQVGFELTREAPEQDVVKKQVSALTVASVIISCIFLRVALFFLADLGSDSHMEDDLTKGAFRLLEIDRRRVVLPEETHIRILVAEEAQ